MLLPLSVSSKVTVKVPAEVKDIKTSRVLISDYIQGKRNAVTVNDSIIAENGVAVFEQTAEGPSRYVVQLSPVSGFSFFTAPGEDITVEVTSLDPANAVFSSSPLMQGVTAIDDATVPIAEKARTLNSASPDYKEQLQALINQYNGALTDYIAASPDSPAVCYALLNLEGEPFITAFEQMTPAAKKSILFPMVQQRYDQQARALKMQKMQDEMSNSHAMAPEIALPDVNGKIVKLSDYRGKWVIIDFWGSWCGWCIKGFPELKKTYEANKEKLMVFGVDNGDTKEAWLAAVKKYELPWVNVYNAGEDRSNNPVLQAYGVQGFPTKVIVDPEGKIANITTGEDPAFYTVLSSLLNGKK